MKKHIFATKQLSRKRREVTAHAVGSLNYDLAAELLFPLLLKIHQRNQTAGLAQFKAVGECGRNQLTPSL